jgi:hypothetical protein
MNTTTLIYTLLVHCICECVCTEPVHGELLCAKGLGDALLVFSINTLPCARSTLLYLCNRCCSSRMCLHVNATAEQYKCKAEKERAVCIVCWLRNKHCLGINYELAARLLSLNLYSLRGCHRRTIAAHFVISLHT